MRRAIPYPCRGPRTSRVFSTISASVPCRTSVSFIERTSLWVSHRKHAIRPLGKQQGGFGQDSTPFGRRSFRQFSQVVESWKDTVRVTAEFIHISHIKTFGGG